MYEAKKCPDCGQTFIPTGARADRCVGCAANRKKERAREYREARAASQGRKPRRASRAAETVPEKGIATVVGTFEPAPEPNVTIYVPLSKIQQIINALL